MKPKTEQEIYELSMSKAHEIDPFTYGKGYTQAQQDLLASASESFEEWWESDKDIPEILGRASERVAGITNMAQRCSILSEFWAKEAWQAARLSTLKEILERTEAIEVNREDILPACQEATHYTWLDEQNEKLQKENERLSEKIYQITGEYE